jgi:hypothetical protein
MTVARLVTALEKDYAELLRRIKRTTHSQEQVRTVEEIQNKWKDIGHEDLQHTVDNNNTVTKCPEEQDPKRYIPRYKKVMEHQDEEVTVKRQRRSDIADGITEAWKAYHQYLVTGEGCETPLKT